jgi:hypothetical protein
LLRQRLWDHPGVTTEEWVFSPAVETGWSDEHLDLPVARPWVFDMDLLKDLTAPPADIRICGGLP